MIHPNKLRKLKGGGGGEQMGVGGEGSNKLSDQSSNDGPAKLECFSLMSDCGWCQPHV